MSSYVEESVNKLVRGLINSIIGVSEYAIPAKENFPRPNTGYCSVNTNYIKAVGWDESKLEDAGEDVDNEIQGYREIMISLNFYRVGSIDNAHKINIGLIRETTRDLFNSASLGLIRRSEVRDISERLEKGWEKRAQMDLFLSTVVTDNELIRSIQSITLSGEFETGVTSIPIETQV